MKTEAARVGWGFWFAWVGANLLAWLPGVVVFLLALAAMRSQSSGSTPSMAGALGMGITAAIAAWIAVGLGVATIPRRIVRAYIALPGSWIGASLAGWAAASLVTLPAVRAALAVARLFSPQADSFDLAFYGFAGSEGRLVFATAGLTIGAVLGFAQWFVLRETVRSAGWWVLASVVGWALGLLVWFLLPVVVGAFTGLALVWLLRQPAAAAPISNSA